MNSSSQKNTIIWSVDPTQDPAEAKNIIKELKIWAKHLDCEVLPVSIFSSSALNFPIEKAFPWRDKLRDIAQSSLNRYLKKTQVRGFLPAKLIFVSALSNRKLASEMAKYAERQNAQLIFTGTRSKKTWNLFRLGSFAETLVATSRVPVLLLNPTATPSTTISSILFPTDFSLASKNALMRLEPWSKAFKSKILLFNQVEIPTIYSSEFSGIAQGQAFNMEALTKDIEKSRQRKGVEWSILLEKENIQCSLLVQRQRTYLAADVLKAAKKNKASLIAIASQSGPVAQALLGSVARDILLQAKCPVLIFHRTKAIRKSSALSRQKITRKFLATPSVHTEVRNG